MAAYLIVDVDDLVQHFFSRGMALNLQELAIGMRGGAALAAGLMSKDQLKAVAVADWPSLRQRLEGETTEAEYIFKSAGYETYTFSAQRRKSLADALVQNFFAFDPDPVDELILATTSRDLIPLAQRIKMTRNARIRVWGARDGMSAQELGEDVIFQPLETLIGIPQSKKVAIYIDFENIAISLNEQGFTVNLDVLVEGFTRRAKAYGQVTSIAAYAPWGQRGKLPPLVDTLGREVSDEAPSRLMMANIDPVFNLPGKNSADMRIARDILTDSSHSDAADTYILASGDRDFKDVLNTLRGRNKQVILWSVRGTTSQLLSNTPDIAVEYIEDFTSLQTHQQLSRSAIATDTEESGTPFTPSQWSSVIIQFDRMAQPANTETLLRSALLEQLIEVGAVASRARGEELLTQATSIGILQVAGVRARLNAANPIVERTRLIRDRIVLRVMNTLSVRGWEYVNYGFLLKGLAMDRDLERPGMNFNDQWRSDWIDCLVREKLLLRELVPHRHNPDDLVPVIKMRPDFVPHAEEAPPPLRPAAVETVSWTGVSMEELSEREPETFEMVRRIIVSVEQFTSFRGFDWCPLGSLHRRLRNFDKAMSFQRGVEYLMENGSADVKEYANPQSEFLTKGISLRTDSPICRMVLSERDAFILMLLNLYERNIIISEQSMRALDVDNRFQVPLWFSIMETENVINPIPGRPGQYSLFRTHHTVTLVADAVRKPGSATD